jgi:hypothetical protein
VVIRFRCVWSLAGWLDVETNSASGPDETNAARAAPSQMAMVIIDDSQQTPSRYHGDV